VKEASRRGTTRLQCGRGAAGRNNDTAPILANQSARDAKTHREAHENELHNAQSGIFEGAVESRLR
jgi:hypothetical protein